MNCGGFFIAADFLYWRAENHGFSYAYELETTVPAGQNVGKVLRISPEWEPAFRAGLGWNSNYDFWDLFLNYTWYGNYASDSRTSTNGFFQMWPLASILTTEFGAVTARSRFVMNMGDLEIGRLMYLTRSIAIRPYLGARGGTLRQKFQDHLSSRLSGNFSEFTFSGRNNYWGVGPRTGVNGEWHVGRGFSFLGKVAGALLYGKTKARNLAQSLAVGASAFTIDRHYKDNFYQLVPHLQLSLGLQWQTCFWCETMFFKMSASWENNYWWNQFNVPVGLVAFIPPLPTVGNQPLTMEGLTVNFEWDF